MLKIYRLIFRVDYPLSHQLLDSLGRVTDFVQNSFDSLKAKQEEVKLDIVNRRIEASCVDKYENGMLLIVELQSTHGSFDFKDGMCVSDIRRFFGIKIVQDVLDQLKLESLKNFKRFGIRCLFLAEKPSFTFDTINRYIMNQEKVLSKSFSESGFSQDDIMVRIVGQKEMYGLGISYGPFKKNEAPNHFLIAPATEEALILDIDLFTSNLEAHKIDFKTKLDIYLYEIEKLAIAISAKVDEGVNV